MTFRGPPEGRGLENSYPDLTGQEREDSRASAYMTHVLLSHCHIRKLELSNVESPADSWQVGKTGSLASSPIASRAAHHKCDAHSPSRGKRLRLRSIRQKAGTMSEERARVSVFFLASSACSTRDARHVSSYDVAIHKKQTLGIFPHNKVEK